jgi:hypothetical protein
MGTQVDAIGAHFDLHGRLRCSVSTIIIFENNINNNHGGSARIVVIFTIGHKIRGASIRVSRSSK